MKKNIRITLTAVAAAGVVLAGLAAAKYLRYDRKAVMHDQYVFIPTGADMQTVIDSLAARQGLIADMAVFAAAARANGLDKKVYPGRYLMQEGMSYKRAARSFRMGTQKPVRVTFNNIRTLDRLAGNISRQIEPDSLAILLSLSDEDIVRSYGFTRQTFPAMFIPDTYEFYWNTTPEKFIERMNREYDRFWNDSRTEKLATLNLTREEASTLASIVYEETKMGDEMPIVAGVYINRIEKGMPLQADPTVKFAVGDPTIRRVMNRHLEVDSPYNSYKYAGLPPGPICIPSIRAIDAVLDYKRHNYLYFCAKPDFSGYHNFATTLEQHNRNAREYAQFLNRNGIR